MIEVGARSLRSVEGKSVEIGNLFQESGRE
jgi:hypothetical protein